MNYETTKSILEKLKPYVDIESLDISTENTNRKGRKYKSAFIEIDKEIAYAENRYPCPFYNSDAL
ncbi:MAG: hypothetical protein LBR68_02680 [Lachnoclostridium sp.]|jgi:hypothetical protein|nr:hypothetical protein [Lachnoclostridium sp.]